MDNEITDNEQNFDRGSKGRGLFVMSTQADRLSVVQAGHDKSLEWSRTANAPAKPQAISPSTPPQPRATGLAKRVFDLMVTIPAMLFLSPLFVGVALAIRLTDGGNVIYKHKRIGYGGKEFYCLKFRSMVLDAEARLNELLASDPEARAEWARDQKLRHDPRITPIGRFLRKTSLDELPQLWNIVRGEMSVVGPRPIVRSEVERYGDFFNHYTSVLPGVTGLWQVSGRNNTTYKERVELDAQYAVTWSLRKDILILLKTIPAVIKSRGAY